MKVATAARSNSSLGDATLFSLTTGDQNVAIGHNAMYNCTTGYQNTCVGSGAVGSNVPAGFSLTTGFYNTLIGNRAGYNLTTSERNTLIGYNAGSNLTTGGGSGNGRNIAIGDDAVFAAADDHRSIVLGHNTTGLGDETTIIRGSSGVYNGNNTSSWNTTSDERIKKNIVDNNTGLDILNQIQVRNFEYRTEEEIVDFDNPKAAVVKKEGLQLGVIAQEIAKVLPELVETQSTGVKTVDPDNLTWYMINAIKELSAKVETLQTEINTLKGG